MEKIKEKNNAGKYISVYVMLLIILTALFFVCLCKGSVDIPIRDIINVILRKEKNDTYYNIIWNIRMPRIIAAIILGGALSVSGFLLQTFFRNPIAGPYVLGVSSGAKLVVAITLISFVGNGTAISSWILIFAAFIGSMLTMLFVLSVSKRVLNMSVLVICGVMIGYICSAVTDFLITFADDSNIVNLHNWSLGSFSGISWDNISVMSIMVFLAVVFAFFSSKPMYAYMLGEGYAKNLGVNIKGLRISLILISSILSACVTAFAGPVSFVGIAVPHLIKNLFKTTKPAIIIPASFLGGSLFCLVCDLIARVMFAPVELNIGSVTALLGAPVVISLMINSKRR